MLQQEHKLLQEQQRQHELEHHAAVVQQYQDQELAQSDPNGLGRRDSELLQGHIR
jgi:hypothetical protein